MRSFVQRYLDPVDRLGEVLFGLIMALGFTGAVRLGVDEPDNRELFFSILGCNLAWGIVDGVMFAMVGLFEQGRKARMIKHAVNASSESDALRQIGDEFDNRLEDVTTPEERDHLYRQILKFMSRAPSQPARLKRDDVMGAIAVAILIMMATFPMLVPFLVFNDPEIAVRLSNLIALAMLFGVGIQWGKMVGARPLNIGAGVAAVGIVLVLITIALGG